MTGVTRNKSDIKMESDPLAPLLEQPSDDTRTVLTQKYKEHSRRPLRAALFDKDIIFSFFFYCVDYLAGPAL